MLAAQQNIKCGKELKVIQYQPFDTTCTGKLVPSSLTAPLDCFNTTTRYGSVALLFALVDRECPSAIY